MSASISEMINKIDEVFESSHSSTTAELLNDLSISQISSSDDEETSLLTNTSEMQSITNDSDISSNYDDSNSNFGSSTVEDSTSFNISNSNDVEINSFLSLFNTKYGCNAKNLDQVFSSVDSLIRKNSKSNSVPLKEEHLQESIAVENLINEVEQLEDANKELQKQLEATQKENENLQKKIDEKERKTNSIVKQNASLQSDLTGIQGALEQMQEITESQLNDITKLGKQRSQLVEITNKQAKIIQKLEGLKTPKIVISSPSKQEQKAVSSEKEREDEAYTLLSSISKIVDENLPYSLSKGLLEIKNNSTLKTKERILMIAKNMTEIINSSKGKENSEIRKTKELSENCDTYKKKCFELIGQFRELLNFMQTLTKSNDLQNTLSGEVFNDETKSSIVRKYCHLLNYVQETIGAISEDRINEIGYVANETHIYELLKPANIEEKVSTITDFISNDNVDALEVSNLLSAQMFINEILKSHISALYERLSLAQREIANARQPTETFEDLIPVNRQLTKQIAKIRKFLLHIVPEKEEDETVYEMLKRAIKTLAEENEAEIQKAKEEKKLVDSFSQMSEEENSSFKKASTEDGSKKHMSSSIGRNYQNEAKKLSKQVGQMKKELEKLTSKINKEKENKKVLVKKNAELVSRIGELENGNNEKAEKIKELEMEGNKNSQIVEAAKTMAETTRNERNELSDKLADQEEAHKKEVDEYKARLDDSNNKLEEMKKKNEENAKIVQKIKKQRHALGKKIERLLAANKMLQETLDCQSVRVKRECKDTLNDLQIQAATAKRELQRRKEVEDELKEKIKQQQTEIASITASKKTLEFKLKTAEEKMELERKGFASQLSTQSSVAQMSQQNKFNEAQKRIDEAYKNLSTMVTASNLPETLEELISLVSNEVQNLRTSQVTYISTLDSLKRLQSILGAKTVNEMCNVAEELVENNNKPKELTNKEPEQETKLVVEKLKRALRSSELSAAQLKQWEMWGRRLNALLHEGEIPKTIDSSGIRQSLEEIILSSISHRKIFDRVESLRTQKRVLMRYDKRLLAPITSSVTLRDLMIVCVTLRRMAKRACVLKVFNE